MLDGMPIPLLPFGRTGHLSTRLIFGGAALSRVSQEVADQTVFFIEDYANGYFWGRGVVQVTNAPSVCMKLTGSVTPEGNLHISFTTIVPGAPPELTPKATGIGTMRLQYGQWTMQLQMTSGFKKLLTHWANMALCRRAVL